MYKKIINCIKRVPIDISNLHEYKMKIKYQNNKYLVKKENDLIRFKNIGEGKRCFIIGNGPSLRKEDLELLKNEFTLASNGIFSMFEQTNWRPTYYFLGDPDYAKFIGDKIKIPINYSKESFLIYTHLEKYPNDIINLENVYFYKQPYRTIFEIIGNKALRQNKPKFSHDVVKCIYSVGTITYEMLQMAIYMGFDEIYLLGIDHNYYKKGAHFNGHKDMNIKPPENLICWEYGYEQAKKQASKRGIKIYNVTRGGYLEVFERKELNEVI